MRNGGMDSRAGSVSWGLGWELAGFWFETQIVNQKLESDNKRGDQTFSEHCQGALEHLMNTDVCVRNKKKK